MTVQSDTTLRKKSTNQMRRYYDVTRTLRHLLAGTRNMPSQKGKRAKGIQMTEQQPKTPQIIDIVEMPPTADIVQIPATQDIVQSPPTQNGSQTPIPHK
jgi:hypothetical protein